MKDIGIERLVQTRAECGEEEALIGRVGLELD